MFGLTNNNGNKEYSELGGEIHVDRKRRERNAIIVFVIVAVIVLNVILYLISQG